MTIATIADTISASVGSLRVGRYTSPSGRRDDIRVKLLDRYNRAPTDISRIRVRNIGRDGGPLERRLDRGEAVLPHHKPL